MRFESIVALRYLRAKRKQAAISLITFIAILGVTAGVAALVIALSINRGFTQDLQDKLLGAQPHITVLTYSADGIRDYREVITRIEAVDGVVSAAPAMYEPVILDNTFRQEPSYLKGIEGDEDRHSPALELVEGSLEDFGPDSILIGEELARSMGSVVGDQVIALSASEPYPTPFGGSPRRRRFTVIGIFRTGLYEFDAGYAFAPLQALQRLTGSGDAATQIEVELEDLDLADVLAPEIESAAGDGFEAVDWKTRNASIFHALQLERRVMFITIGLIVVVASLNIVVTLVMMTMEKTRDIAVLMSMGATREQIRRVFTIEGVVIGVVGTVLGLVLGNVLSYLADTYRWISIAPEVYSIAYVPFRPSLLDSVIVGAAAIAIGYLATIYPSRTASRIQPVEALRYE